MTALVGTITQSYISWLLLFIPVSLAIRALSLPGSWLFATAALAIIPLAAIISDATGQLASRAGSGVGGLMNATFGNFIELVVAVIALREGLGEVVKASISGSIIGNVLFALGLSMLAGGWGKEHQTFNRTRAGAGAAGLFLSAVALVMPAIFNWTVSGTRSGAAAQIEDISIVVAVLLIATYLVGLVFTLKTHRNVFSSSASPENCKSDLSISASLALLLAASIFGAIESDSLVEGISDVTQTLGLSQFFVGVIVVGVVGNAAEYVSSVRMAMSDNMQLAVNISVGSSIQIAAFVAPALIFISLLLGHPISLVFNVFEVSGITLAVLALSIVSLDGESTWFEGVQLLAVYLILATVFFFVPAS